MSKCINVFRITLFFLKTLFFSLKSNSACAVLIPIIVVAKLTGDIDKHMVLLSMLSLSMYPALSGNVLFTLKSSTAGLYTHQWLWPSLLPISSEMMVRCIGFASLLYGVIIHGLLLFFLDGTTHVSPSVILSPPDDTGVVIWQLSGHNVAGDPWTLKKRLLPSTLFGIINKHRRYPVFPAWQTVLYLFFLSLTVYSSLVWCKRFCIRQKRNMLTSSVHTFSVFVVAAIMLLVIADMVLAPAPLYIMRKFVDAHALFLPILFGSMSTVFFVGATSILFEKRLYQ